MKKSLIAICIILALSSILYLTHTTDNKPDADTKLISNSYKQINIDNKKLYDDALSAFLHPYIQKAIDDWSTIHPEYSGGDVDPWDTKILSVERMPDQTSKLWFLIKVEVMPYVLAHISVGRDRITFMVKPTGDVTLKKLERIESYDDWKKIRQPKLQ